MYCQQHGWLAGSRMVNKRFGELIGVSEGIAFGNGDGRMESVPLGRGAVQKKENRIKTSQSLPIDLNQTIETLFRIFGKK